MAFVLSTEVILKDAKRIHEYRGDDNYALSSFLRQVDRYSYIYKNNLKPNHTFINESY